MFNNKNRKIILKKKHTDNFINNKEMRPEMRGKTNENQLCNMSSSNTFFINMNTSSINMIGILLP